MATETVTRNYAPLTIRSFLIAALHSKALALVFPPIVLLYDVLVRREKTARAIARQVIPGLLSLLLLF